MNPFIFSRTVASLEEYVRLEGGEGSSRLRVFLFSTTDYDLIHFHAMNDEWNVKQQYVDVINGISSIPETGFGKHADSIKSSSMLQAEKMNAHEEERKIWRRLTNKWDSMHRMGFFLASDIVELSEITVCEDSTRFNIYNNIRMGETPHSKEIIMIWALIKDIKLSRAMCQTCGIVLPLKLIKGWLIIKVPKCCYHMWNKGDREERFLMAPILKILRAQ